MHLQLALGGPGAPGEDLQDQAGAVDDLELQRLLQVALLHGGEDVVDDHQVGLDGVRLGVQRLHLAASEQGGGRRGAQRRDLRVHHLQIEGLGEAHRLLQPLLGRAQGRRSASAGMDDERPLPPRRVVDPAQAASSSVGS